MKLFHLLFAGSVALPGFAFVLGTREPGQKLSQGPSRGRDEALKGRRDIQYDGYLPELPAGWPNIKPNTTNNIKTAANSTHSTAKTDLASRSRGDVATRDNSNEFEQYIYMGVKVFSVSNAAVNWSSLSSSCEQYTQEVSSGIQCVWGAISQIVGIATLTYQATIVRGQLSTTITNNGWNVTSISKRDEWASTMARDLSDGLQTEVRHLGTWGGIMPHQKRDSGPVIPREVFGVSRGGYDFHFTYMGRDAYGKNSLKIGLGNGRLPLKSEAHRRGLPTDDNFYFSSGGIDFEVESVLSSVDPEWSWVSPLDSVEFDGIYNSVQCYNEAFDGYVFENSNAIAFQVYDSYGHDTLSAGIMSPFSATAESAIRSMSLEGGLGFDFCSAF